MVTKFTALLAITLRTISPSVKHVKEQSLQCTRYWFLGAISSLACYIHIANTGYIYCKPSFIRLQEIFARASSLRIFLAANRSLLYGCNGISSGNKAYSWKIVTCKNQLPCVYQNREIKLSLIKVGFYSTCTDKNRMCYEITVIILIHNYINKKIIKMEKYLIYLFIIITPFVYSISAEYFIIRTWTIHTKSTINYNP